MTNQNNNEKRSFLGSLFDLVSSFFSKLALKAKIIIGAIIGFLGLLSIFWIRKEINEKEILKLEIKKIRKEIEIEKNQAAIDVNNEKINSLEAREAVLRKEVEEILSQERGGEVSLEELDSFFDERGF